MEKILKELIRKCCLGEVSINVRDYLHESEFKIRKLLTIEKEPPHWFKEWLKNEPKRCSKWIKKNAAKRNLKTGRN